MERFRERIGTRIEEGVSPRNFGCLKELMKTYRERCFKEGKMSDYALS
jgi:hypothetical protein